MLFVVIHVTLTIDMSKYTCFVIIDTTRQRGHAPIYIQRHLNIRFCLYPMLVSVYFW